MRAPLPPPLTVCTRHILRVQGAAAAVTSEARATSPRAINNSDLEPAAHVPHASNDAHVAITTAQCSDDAGCTSGVPTRKRMRCEGCLFVNEDGSTGHPSQRYHMGSGGCLSFGDSDESDVDDSDERACTDVTRERPS